MTPNELADKFDQAIEDFAVLLAEEVGALRLDPLAANGIRDAAVCAFQLQQELLRTAQKQNEELLLDNSRLMAVVGNTPGTN